MQVILLERVEKLGQIGDVVTVKPGYARNFLLPQKKALRATKGNIEHFETQRGDIEARNLERRKEAEAVAAKLSAANGVYLLVCPRTGEQYVGAAFGTGGFLARWKQYAANGHGGNTLLKRRRKEIDYPLEISILEVFGSTMTEGEAFEAESRWKTALGTRAHGLNAN